LLFLKLFVGEAGEVHDRVFGTIFKWIRAGWQTFFGTLINQ